MKFERVLSTILPSALKSSSPAQNVFASSDESVTLQRKMCSSLATNMLVCKVILYPEVISIDYLIASDKRVHLQCDIIKVKRVVFES